MTTLVDRKHLLTSAEMAHFVSHGSIALSAVVPDALNERAIGVLDAGIPGHPYGTPLDVVFPPGSFVRELLDLPAVAGAVQSLVGPSPVIDHHAVHVRPPHGGEAQNMHGDAILDTRTDAFDVQLMYYPREVTLEQGGTLSVPGTHLRRINQTGIGRYQNLAGQTRLTCPAGTVVLLHHGIWHGGRRNDSDQPRYMFKIRFNPTVRQLRLWNTDDIDDPAVRAELRTDFGWTNANEGRLELVNRAKLWRYLTGDELFDIDYYLTRETIRPTHLAPGATDVRLGSSRSGDGWGLLSPPTTTPEENIVTSTLHPTLSVEESFAVPSATPNLRQQLLVLYLGTSALDSDVIGWSRYDGTGRSRPTMGDSDDPPYATGLHALLDGWRLIHLSQLTSHERGHEYDTAYLPYEFVFERLVDVTA